MRGEKMRCESCANFMVGVDRCKFCHWEFDPGYNPWNRDDWDIFEMDDDEEWSHIQLLKRLKSQGFNCLYADMWTDNNVAWLVGCLPDTEHIGRRHVNADGIADALNLHKESVYCEVESGLIILNLFQEKYLRGMLDGEKED